MLKVASVSELHMKERWSEVEHEQLSQGAPPNSRVLYCPLTSSTWDMLSWWVKLSSKDASDCWTVTFELWRAESARCWVHESCDRGRWGPWVWEQGQMAVHWVMDSRNGIWEQKGIWAQSKRGSMITRNALWEATVEASKEHYKQQLNLRGIPSLSASTNAPTALSTTTYHIGV